MKVAIAGDGSPSLLRLHHHEGKTPGAIKRQSDLGSLIDRDRFAAVAAP